LLTATSGSYAGSSTAQFQVLAAVVSGSSSSVAPSGSYDQIKATGGLTIGSAGNTLSGGASTSGVTLQLNMTQPVFNALQNSAATAGNPYSPTGGNVGLANYYVFTLSSAAQGLFQTLTVVEGGNTLTGTIYYAGVNDRFGNAISDGSLGDVLVTNGDLTTDPNYIAQEFAISYMGSYGDGTTTGGNDIVLTAIPEPGTWGMILGGFGMLIGFQRLRKRRTDS
jgi:hypothetical protein